jgi:hypothetical protein
MPYCSECGAEYESADEFCSSCGTEIEPAADASPSDSTSVRDGGGWTVKIAATVMGIITAVFLYTNIYALGFETAAAILTIAAALGVSYYLQQSHSSVFAVVGQSLYYLAFLVLTFPFAAYLPILFRTSNPQTNAEAFAQTASIVSILVWGIIALIVAIILAGVGYGAKRKAA